MAVLNDVDSVSKVWASRELKLQRTQGYSDMKCNENLNGSKVPSQIQVSKLMVSAVK
jgi:hypothetical protein